LVAFLVRAFAVLRAGALVVLRAAFVVFLAPALGLFAVDLVAFLAVPRVLLTRFFAARLGLAVVDAFLIAAMNHLPLPDGFTVLVSVSLLRTGAQSASATRTSLRLGGSKPTAVDQREVSL
jgi:hypothetical protein